MEKYTGCEIHRSYEEKYNESYSKTNIAHNSSQPQDYFSANITTQLLIEKK